MHQDFEELLDKIDACVYTGDCLENPKNRELLENYLNKWGNTLDSYLGEVLT